MLQLVMPDSSALPALPTVPPRTDRLQHAVEAMLTALCVLAAIAYLIWPPWTDVTVHMTGIHLAGVQDRGLLGAWTFRPVLFNAYLATLHALVTPFAGFASKAAFETLVKVVHLVVILGVCGFWAHHVAAARGVPRAARTMAAVLVFAFLVSAFDIAIQAEEVAVLAMLLAWGFLARGGARSVTAAALLAASLPFYKGVTALYGLPLLVVAWTTFGPRRAAFYRFAVSSAVAAVLFVLVLAWLAPQQIRDLVEAGVYQGSFESSWGARLSRLVTEGRRYAFVQPVLLPGGLATVLVAGAALRRRAVGKTVLLVVLWVVPVLVVLIQDMYFDYHFVAATVPAAYAIGLLSGPSDYPTRRWVEAATVLVLGLGAARLVWANPRMDDGFEGVAVTAIFLVVALVMISVVRPVRASALVAACALAMVPIWGGVTSPILGSRAADLADARSTAEDTFDRLARTNGIGPRQEVLYLAYGTAAYFLGAPSACRHYFPIPLQRYRPERADAFEQTEAFQENRDCALEFGGEFVVLQDTWFRLPLHPELERKLLDDFEPVERFAGMLSRGDEYVLLRRRHD
jgi:hypothetical protein